MLDALSNTSCRDPRVCCTDMDRGKSEPPRWCDEKAKLQLKSVVTAQQLNQCEFVPKYIYVCTLSSSRMHVVISLHNLRQPNNLSCIEPSYNQANTSCSSELSDWFVHSRTAKRMHRTKSWHGNTLWRSLNICVFEWFEKTSSGHCEFRTNILKVTRLWSVERLQACFPAPVHCVVKILR